MPLPRLASGPCTSSLGDGVPSDYVEAVRWYRQEERPNINISELSDAVNNRPNRFQ